MRDALHRDNWPVLAAGAALALSVVSIAASQICLGLAIVLTIPHWRRAQYPQSTLLLAFFFLWTLLAAALSPAPAAAWPQIRKFFVFLIVPALLAANPARPWIEKILQTLAAGGLLSALWSLVQYAKKYQAAKAAGLDFTSAYVADRITGFMSHWMTFGGTMMTVFLIAAAYAIFHKPRPWRLLPALALLAAALFLGWTRGIWIGTFAGVVYLAWSFRRALVIVPPLLALAGLAVMPEPEKGRVLSIFKPRGDTDSNAHRIALFRTGVAMIEAHPLTGVGPEQVERNFEKYAPADIPRPFPRSWWYGHLHNIYIHYSADRGIPAMLAIVGFFLAAFWTTARAARRHADWLLHGIAAFLIGLLVTGVFEHNLADSEILMLALGLATLGCLAARQRDTIPL
jgi:putative inorganic carbon (HCO3(-)) transporter